MMAGWQDIVALFVVAAAVLFVLRHRLPWRWKRKESCATGGCGRCPLSAAGKGCVTQIVATPINSAEAVRSGSARR